MGTSVFVNIIFNFSQRLFILLILWSLHERRASLIAKIDGAQFFRKIPSLPKMSQSAQNTPKLGFLKFLELFIVDFYWNLGTMLICFLEQYFLL